MNITMNELLLLGNKKIKFGEGESNKTASAAPVPETTESQSGMNALMFQGMQNLMSNPGLAQSVNFKGGAMQNVAKKAVLPVAAGIAALAMQSCVEQEVSVDMSQFSDMMAQLTSAINELKEQGKLTNNLLAQMNSKMSEIYSEIANGNITMEEGFKELFSWMFLITENQSAILDQLEANGMSQEEANNYLKQLIAEVQSGKKSAEQALNEIINKLTGIDDKLGDIYNTLLRVEAKFDSYAKEALKYAKSIDATGKATYEEVKGLRAASDSMLVQNNEKIELLQQILDENKKNNAITASGMSILIRQGYTQQQITAMGFAQANALLANILKQEKATNAKLQEILNYINSGKIEEAAKMIIELLQSIDNKLDTINANIEKLYNSIEDAKKKFFPMFRDLVINNRVQTGVLLKMGKTLDGVADDVAALKANSDSLIILANEKPDEIIEAIKRGDAGIMAILRFNGISQQQAMYMSTQQIIAAINKFRNEYVTNEEKENNQRLIIIDLLQNPVYNTNEGVIKAITDVTAAINAGKTDLAAELEKLYQKLAEIEAKLTPVLAKLSTYIDGAQANWNKLFDYMQKAQDAAATDHAQMNAYLKLANVYLEKLLKDADGIKENTDNLNNIAGGSGLTAADIDALLDKYATKINNNNNSNINKLLPLLQQMANDLSKLDKTQDPDYTMLLNQIKDAIEKLRVHEGIQNSTGGITP